MRRLRILFLRCFAAAGAWLLASAAFAASPEPVRLKVMTFNVEYGGTVVDFDRVLEAIRRAAPDIVGLEEPEGNTREIARRLGWQYANLRTDVVSRFPILDPPGGNGRFVYVEVRPGEAVAVANIHLPSDPYGPYLVRDDAPRQEVLALERALRLPEIRPVLDAVAPLPKAGFPVFLMGDFNAPSHEDWTRETVGLWPHLRYPLVWPVSRAVVDAGFRDTYRAAHPDPAEAPGLTWWVPRPSTEDVYTEADPPDRIDFLYAAGPVRVLDSTLVGEPGAPGVTIGVTPWPSDHRAVLSTVEVTPAWLPDLVAVNDQRLVTTEETLTVHFRRRMAAGQTIAVRNAKGTVVARSTLPEAELSGTVPVSLAGFEPGAYEAVLADAGNRVLSRVPFHVKAPGTAPVLSVDKRVYRPGEPITVRWRDVPGNRWDWLALYETPAGGRAVPSRNGQRLWRYTGASVEGSLVIDRHVQDGTAWPLSPGRYTLFYLLHDGYEPAAEVTFEVRG
jgi:endonuclease/exonuclease/phosphatase family metal-dependent hydrolase